jgi:hypothetical protein
MKVQATLVKEIKPNLKSLRAAHIEIYGFDPLEEEQKAMGWAKSQNICEHMPDDPDVTQCSFCGYEKA